MSEKLLDDLVRSTPNISLIAPINYKKALSHSLGKPMIINQAEGLRTSLYNLPIIIRPDELIVGTMDEKVPVAIPRLEGSGFRILKELEILPTRPVNPINVNNEEINLLRKELAPFYENFNVDTYAREIAPSEVFETQYSGCAYIATEIGGIAHAVINYPRLLTIGLKKYIDLTEEKINSLKQEGTLVKDPQSDKKIAYYKAIKIVCCALREYSKKYSNKAKHMVNEENEPFRRAELKKIAQTCENISEKPPSNLQEAIQLIWFIHMALHLENFEHGISFGRVDQYLMPYYDGDSELALRLLKNLLLKTNEIIALYDSVATIFFGGMATTQNILIGGVNQEGNDATNEMTYIILRAINEACLPSPNLVIRIHENSPPQLLKYIAKVLSKENNVIGLYNDGLIIKSLMNCGIPLEEARNYAVVGCVGLSTSGTSYDNTGAIFLSMPKALEIVLETDTSIISQHLDLDLHLGQYDSMEDIINAYRKAFRAIIEMSITAGNAYQQAHRVLKPTPLMSLCIDGSFEKGLDVSEGVAKYNFSGLHVTGFSDVIDSFAALDWAVFQEKKVSLSELQKALMKNFRGYKEIHQYLKNKCPKYGNDDDRADKYAQILMKILNKSVQGFKCSRGGDYRIGIHAMTTHVGFGIFTGALPSGRKKGKPLNRDIAPGYTGEKGLTSALKSITKSDHSLLTNGVACTLNINPKIARLEKGEIFSSLLKSYIQLKGSHLQFNSISMETLQDAQINPQNYKCLMVRVSGYSARFIDLPKAVQDDIMNRYCYGNV